MKVVKLTESDLKQIILKVLKEDEEPLPGTENTPPSDVQQVQQALVDAGYDIGPTGVDGIFGRNTRAAVIRYQRDNGIKQTGNVGPVTSRRLGVQPLTSGKPSKPQTRTTTTQKKAVTPQTKTAPKKKVVSKSGYKYSPRIDQELQFIKQRGLDDSPFFIYDPKDNLIYLFNKGGVFVDYSQVVDGADQQKDREPMTIDMWCKISGLDSTPHKCTNPKTKKPSSPSYGSLAKVAERFVPKGIYKISYLMRNAGYQGKGKNVFKLQDEKGKTISAAIHGIPNIPARLTASAELESVLKKDLSSGKVPQEYLNSIEKITKANQSFGCIGVPQKFIDNPNVQKLASNAKVFIMGDQNKSFLVQNAEEYFDTLSSDGTRCYSPTGLASRMGEQLA